MARVEGNAEVPLNVMCSMKWATPAWSGPSRREPARTYAAMETERAPARRALITRGPEGSAVRSNIARMVQEGARRFGPVAESGAPSRAQADYPVGWIVQ